MSTDDDDTDDDARTVIERRSSISAETRNGSGDMNVKSPRVPSPSPLASSSDGSKVNGRTSTLNRRTFTRSRSPAPRSLGIMPQPVPPSPTSFFRARSAGPAGIVLPGTLSIKFPLWPTSWEYQLRIDAKHAAEGAILMSALACVAQKLQPFSSASPSDDGLPIELHAVIFASFTYLIWNHSSCMRNPPSSTPIDLATSDPPPNPPRLQELRAPRRGTSTLSSSPISENRGYVWMTVPKNYRTSTDDGLSSGLILGPLITSAMYFVALKFDMPADGTSQPPFWLIEAPWRINNEASLTPRQALAASRRNAVDLSTLCSAALLIHVYASHWFEWRHRRRHKVCEGERGSVPRSEARKGWMYIIFTYIVCVFLLALRFAFDRAQLGVWKHLSYWEIASGSAFFQFSLYVAVRLGHRGFTLGELGLVVFGATSLFTESVNLTVAKIWPVTTTYIKTYRLPTPLLIFQLALIPGSLLTGLLLSPLLTLSRHIAQRPVRRLRFPHEKQAHRRALAVGFYLGAAFIVGGLIGSWVRWLLGRDPWLWVVFWLLEGPRPWTRPALLGTGPCLMARSRRFRPRLPTGSEPATMDANTATPSGSDPTTPVSGSGSLGLASASLTSSAVVSSMFPTMTIPHLPTDLGLGASEWLDAADRRVPTLSLNARRKFFHALAVVCSAAFALFVFAEYVRYFALYPLGAAVHVFMSDFLDSKDSGTAILSHFYLLTGCAGALWLEAPSRLLMYTGILTVGVGDAVASVIGKRVGRYRWSPTTPKTLEGSAGFTLSVVVFAWALRVCGLVEEFSIVRYGIIIGVGSMLEAVSGQNDNIILPLYVWSMLVIGLE
ncbi:hypothetical protein BGW80DRAFT_1342802 [Lactifluus volemus]|nr:hypothetical protein BGW80DRAFT_1342802 [Lactifluus volemus]